MSAPRVGETWLADLRGRVPWATGHSAVRGPVRLEWVSSDGRVVEVVARPPAGEKKKRQSARTSLARCDLVRRLDAEPVQNAAREEVTRGRPGQ